MRTPPPSTEPHRREWIKYQLRLAGYSLRQLATELGVDPSSPVKALQRRWPRMEREIARKLRVKPQELWPERYDDKGRPVRLAKGLRPRKASQKREA